MKKYLLFILIAIFLIAPLVVFAAEWKWGDPLVICGTSITPPCTLCDIFRLAQVIVKFITTGLFIIAPIFIVMGGIKILIGGAKPDEVQSGKKMITNAIIGIIIALLAWVVLNMIFNELAKAPGEGGIPWPWNQINCTGGGVKEDGGGGTVVEPGQYCVCETPVYDLDPSQFSQASKIATNAKQTALVDQKTCEEKCVQANTGNYCLSSLRPNEAKLYCASTKGLQSISGCTIHWDNDNCKIGTKCYNSEQECLNDGFDTFKSRCYLDGQNLCECYRGGSKSVCNSDNSKYALFRIKTDVSENAGSLYNCQSKGSNPFRINCQYDKCSAGGVTAGSCTGVSCDAKPENLCSGYINVDCSINTVSKWNTQIEQAAYGKSICANVGSTTGLVKAIMAAESSGNIKAISKDKNGNPLAGGLMQLLPSTANILKSKCNVSENIDFNWLTNSDNAEKQICIAIELMKTSAAGECGCDVRHIAAGYNGSEKLAGEKKGACEKSANCGTEASADGGNCLICPNEPYTRAWECLWADNKHTICDPAFAETRAYVPRVNHCYEIFR